MPITHDLVIAHYEFENDEGEKKTKWQTVGKIIETEYGKQLVKIDCIPTTICEPHSGKDIPWDGWIKVFPHKSYGPERPDPKTAKRVTKADRMKARGVKDDDDFPDDCPF